MSTSRTPRRLSPATVLAALALAVSVGHTAYAAATIGTADIKDGAVTRAKLGDGAVVARKLATGAVRIGHLAASSVDTSKIQDAQVRAGDLGSIVIVSQPKNISPNTVDAATAECPAGTRVISGGFYTSTVTGVYVTRSTATPGSTDPGGWFVQFNNTTGSTRSVTIEAYCLSA